MAEVFISCGIRSDTGGMYQVRNKYQRSSWKEVSRSRKFGVVAVELEDVLSSVIADTGPLYRKFSGTTREVPIFWKDIGFWMGMEGISKCDVSENFDNRLSTFELKMLMWQWLHICLLVTCSWWVCKTFVSRYNTGAPLKIVDTKQLIICAFRWLHQCITD